MAAISYCLCTLPIHLIKYFSISTLPISEITDNIDCFRDSIYIDIQHIFAMHGSVLGKGKMASYLRTRGSISESFLWQEVSIGSRQDGWIDGCGHSGMVEPEKTLGLEDCSLQARSWWASRRGRGQQTTICWSQCFVPFFRTTLRKLLLIYLCPLDSSIRRIESQFLLFPFSKAVFLFKKTQC